MGWDQEPAFKDGGEGAEHRASALARGCQLVLEALASCPEVQVWWLMPILKALQKSKPNQNKQTVKKTKARLLCSRPPIQQLLKGTQKSNLAYCKTFSPK